MPNQEASVPLSERELQVLQMVATGASNQEIARQLVISINTVKVHIRNIFEKLGVQSRTEASLRAIQEGWVTVSDDNGVEASETTASPSKTYLLTHRPQPALARWQHFYLTFIILVTLAAATTPFYSKRTQEPYVPPIIKKDSERALYGSEEISEPIVSQGSSASRWTSRDPMPTHRAGLGLVTFEGQIFAIGGVRTNDKATRFVEIYDPSANSWTEGAAKPTATTNISSVALFDKIYVPGGCTNDRQAVNILEIYDPKTDKWEQGQPLPQARCGYGLVALNNKLYLLGGWNGETFEDTIFVFSPAENEWEVRDSTLAHAIGYMGAATFNNLIYVAGGYDGRAEYNQTYAFNPETGVWLEKSPMQEERGGLGLITIANHIYAVGGGWDHALETSEKYDPATDRWTTFETPFPNQWRNLGLTVVDAEIFAVGGWDGTDQEYMNDIVSYNVSFQLFLPLSTTGQ